MLKGFKTGAKARPGTSWLSYVFVGGMCHEQL